MTPTVLVILEGNELTFLERIKNMKIDIENGNKVDGKESHHNKLADISGYSEQELHNKLTNWRELLKQFEERYAELDLNPIFKVNALDAKINVFQKV